MKTNNFDTFKVKTKVKDFDNDKFIPFGNLSSGVLYNFKPSPDHLKKIDGVSSLSVTPSLVAELEFNAKVLQEPYLTGINKDNLQSVVDYFNNTGLVTIDYSDLLQSEVFRVDVTDNIKVDGDVREYINALNLHHTTANKFIVDSHYNSKKKSGIVFKRGKVRSICYHKQLELMKPKNKSFIQKFPSILTSAQNLCRIETRHTNFVNIRKNFNIDEKVIRLTDVLHSTQPVNYNILEQVMKINTDVIDNPSGNFYKILGIRKLLEICEFDLKKCRAYRKAESPNIDRCQLNREMELIAQCKEYYYNQTTAKTHDLVNELKLKLVA